MNLLDSLIGMRVTGAEVGNDGVSIILSEGVFVAYNPVGGTTPNSLVGTCIKSVKIMENDRLSMEFDDGAELHVSLRDEDFEGPEAFQAIFVEGSTIVGN